MASKKNDAKLYRYNLALPTDVFEQLRDIADKEGVTVVEVLRKFIKFGILALSVQGKPDSALIIREGDTERQIILL